MNAVAGTVRQLTRAANRAATMTTEAAGAIGGAAVNGVIGGVKGAASGAQRGLSSGSHSTPAAALTLGALGVAGLVEWPVLVAVGGTALVIKQLNNRSKGTEPPLAPPAKGPATPDTALEGSEIDGSEVNGSAVNGSAVNRGVGQCAAQPAGQEDDGAAVEQQHYPRSPLIGREWISAVS